VQLVEQVVSAVNIDQYAALVADKYLRRQLIQAGQDILRLGYETSLPIEQVLDQAEQHIFAICQSQPRQELVSTAEMVSTIWQEIEQRSEDMLPPGITSGFYDLDALTQGFQTFGFDHCGGSSFDGENLILSEYRPQHCRHPPSAGCPI
jgi:replicative DNA helicase